ncbi:MAG: hypothetical protein ACRECM_09360, partial [Methyloceanibacter sp.]
MSRSERLDDEESSTCQWVFMAQRKLRPDAAKASGKYPAGVLGDPKPIAQRFAHFADLRQAALRMADPPRASQPAEPLVATREPTASAGGRLAVPTRWLITGLVLAALVPSLILGALWLGSTSETQPPPVAQAPEPQSAAPSAVLTTSARLEAKAGETVSFPIALDGTDGVPSRSVIAIKGLPQGSNFSEGRPYGDSEWNLKPDQIGDLHLVLPAGASGEFKLGIALIGPDDKVIAEAETLLEIAPAPVPAPSEQMPIESGLPSPDGVEAAASEAPLGDGDAQETLATIEAATVPPGDAQTDTVEPTMEAAT